MAPPFEKTFYPKTICVQYVRNPFSSFGEENFKGKQKINFCIFRFSKFRQNVCRWKFNIIFTKCYALELDNLLV